MTNRLAQHLTTWRCWYALLPAVAVVVASVILGPVCEELLYRGVVVRPVHDALARRGAGPWTAAAAAPERAPGRRAGRPP